MAVQSATENPALKLGSAVRTNSTDLIPVATSPVVDQHTLSLYKPRPSVAFNVAVDATNKSGSAQVTHCAAHDGQAQAEHERVAEVEGRLEEARHLCLGEEVVHRVQEHIPAPPSPQPFWLPSHHLYMLLPAARLPT